MLKETHREPLVVIISITSGPPEGRWPPLPTECSTFPLGRGRRTYRAYACCTTFAKNQKKIQQFLTKKLRLENGAKECIV